MREEIINLYQEHKSYAIVGRLKGISRQRVHQIVTGYRPIEKTRILKEKLKLCTYCQLQKATILHQKSSEEIRPVCAKCHIKLIVLQRDKDGYFRSKYTNCKACNKPFNRWFKQRGNGYCAKDYQFFRTHNKSFIYPCKGCGESLNALNRTSRYPYCKKCKRISRQQRSPKLTFICDFCKKQYHPFKNEVKISRFHNMKCYKNYIKKYGWKTNKKKLKKKSS